MTWARAFFYVAVWLILTAYYFVAHPQRPVEEPIAPEIEALPTEPAEAELQYLHVEPERVVEVEVAAGERRVRATRDGERWLAVEPANAVVSSDLISALLSAILGASGVQVVSRDTTRDTEFGLATPTARVRFATSDGQAVDLVLGKENPARTGVYGRTAGSPEIVLVGLNARYYVDMILRPAG
jgi:hypothetical protein